MDSKADNRMKRGKLVKWLIKQSLGKKEYPNLVNDRELERMGKKTENHPLIIKKLNTFKFRSYKEIDWNGREKLVKYYK